MKRLGNSGNLEEIICARLDAMTPESNWVEFAALTQALAALDARSFLYNLVEAVEFLGEKVDLVIGELPGCGDMGFVRTSNIGD